MSLQETWTGARETLYDTYQPASLEINSLYNYRDEDNPGAEIRDQRRHGLARLSGRPRGGPLPRGRRDLVPPPQSRRPPRRPQPSPRRDLSPRLHPRMRPSHPGPPHWDRARPRALSAVEAGGRSHQARSFPRKREPRLFCPRTHTDGDVRGRAPGAAPRRCRLRCPRSPPPRGHEGTHVASLSPASAVPTGRHAPETGPGRGTPGWRQERATKRRRRRSSSFNSSVLVTGVFSDEEDAKDGVACGGDRRGACGGLGWGRPAATAAAGAATVSPATVTPAAATPAGATAVRRPRRLGPRRFGSAAAGAAAGLGRLGLGRLGARLRARHRSRLLGRSVCGTTTRATTTPTLTHRIRLRLYDYAPPPGGYSRAGSRRARRPGARRAPGLRPVGLERAAEQVRLGEPGLPVRELT